MGKEISRKSKSQASRKIGQKLETPPDSVFYRKQLELEIKGVFLNRAQKRILKRKAARGEKKAKGN